MASATNYQQNQHMYHHNEVNEDGCECASHGCCGCTSPNAGLGIVAVLQIFIAAPALIAAGVLMEGWDAGALDIANGVLFVLVSVVLILAIVIRDVQFSNVMIWAALLLHTLMLILCAGGIGWNAYNATIDWGWDFHDTYGIGACIGGGANLLFFFLTMHFICVDNGWRIENLKKRTGHNQPQLFNQPMVAMQHADHPARRGTVMSPGGTLHQVEIEEALQGVVDEV